MPVGGKIYSRVVRGNAPFDTKFPDSREVGLLPQGVAAGTDSLGGALVTLR